jgi:hypothetical protein
VVSSSSGSLAATPGSMSLSMGSSAIMVLTYYTTNSTSPVQLGIGDALTATFNLTFSGLAASNSSQGFRIGVFDFADSTLSPKRVTADGFSSSSQGAGCKDTRSCRTWGRHSAAPRRWIFASARLVGQFSFGNEQRLHIAGHRAREPAHFPASPTARIISCRLHCNERPPTRWRSRLPG